MGCNCGGAPKPSSEPQFLVTLPNGNTKTVTGEPAAKIEITMAGGGTYSMIR